MNPDLEILFWIIGVVCALVIIFTPLFLLSRILGRLDRVIKSIEATQYLIEKHDLREDERDLKAVREAA